MYGFIDPHGPPETWKLLQNHYTLHSLKYVYSKLFPRTQSEISSNIMYTSLTEFWNYLTDMVKCIRISVSNSTEISLIEE